MPKQNFIDVRKRIFLVLRILFGDLRSATDRKMVLYYENRLRSYISAYYLVDILTEKEYNNLYKTATQLSYKMLHSF